MNSVIAAYLTADERRTYHDLRRNQENLSSAAGECCGQEDFSHLPGCSTYALYGEAKAAAERFEVAMNAKYAGR